MADLPSKQQVFVSLSTKIIKKKKEKKEEIDKETETTETLDCMPNRRQFTSQVINLRM